MPEQPNKLTHDALIDLFQFAKSVAPKITNQSAEVIANIFSAHMGRMITKQQATFVCKKADIQVKRARQTTTSAMRYKTKLHGKLGAAVRDITHIVARLAAKIDAQEEVLALESVLRECNQVIDIDIYGIEKATEKWGDDVLRRSRNQG